MSKRLFFFLLFAALGILGASEANASDLIVICPGSGSTCSVSPSGPLFNESDLTPGDSVTRSLNVINQDPNESCNLTLDVVRTNVNGQQLDLAERLMSTITLGSTSYFDDTFTILFGTGFVSLGQVGASSNNLYIWTAEFDSASPNVYQNMSTLFDFDLNFSCTAPPVGSTLSPAGPPHRTDEVAGTSVVASIAQALAPILGIEVEEVPLEGQEAISTPTPTPVGEVQGAAICTMPYLPWWLPLLVQLVLGIGYVFYKKRTEEVNLIDLWPVGLFAIISQVIHQIVGCNCAVSELCKYYWILNLAAVGISISLRFLSHKKNKS